MSDKYYRGLRNILNDTKYKLQLASMALKINENKNSISGIKNDISEINNFSDKINDNSSTISTNLTKIDTNTSSISTNLEKIDNFTQYTLQSGIDFKQKYIIEKQIFRFNKNKHFYTLFEKEIENNFTKNSLLFVKNNIYYKYDELSNDYHRLQHEYNIYNDEDNLIHKYLFNKDTYYNESLDPSLHTNDDFCICFKKNYKKIKINLQLHRHNRHGAGNINLEIDDDNESYINIDYVDRNNNEQVNTNARDISTNLSKINSNEDDILSNLNEINYLKNNKSTQYLKNVYNIKYYDYKKQINFNESFFNKTFNLNLKKNDYIEIDLKMKLEYEDIDDLKIIKTEIKLYNNMNEQIFVSNYFNKDSISYLNFVFLNKNILYNFIEDTTFLKIIIKFEFLQIKSIKKIHYIPTNNDRLYLKHYGN